MNALLFRRGALVALVTTLAIAASLFVKDVLLAVIPAIQVGSPSVPLLGAKLLFGVLPFSIGVFLCLWILVPVAGELLMRFVVARAVLAAATGTVLLLVVNVVALLVQFATSSGSYGLTGSGIYFDGSSLGLAMRGAIVVALQYFVASVPVVLLFALFQWQWLKNHPAKYDVAGILDV